MSQSIMNPANPSAMCTWGTSLSNDAVEVAFTWGTVDFMVGCVRLHLENFWCNNILMDSSLVPQLSWEALYMKSSCSMPYHHRHDVFLRKGKWHAFAFEWNKKLFFFIPCHFVATILFSRIFNVPVTGTIQSTQTDAPFWCLFIDIMQKGIFQPAFVIIQDDHWCASILVMVKKPIPFSHNI